MKKSLFLILYCLFTTIVYSQIKSMPKGLQNFEIIGKCEDFYDVINVGNSIIMSLIENDYNLLSQYCLDEVHFSQELGFSNNSDTIITANDISAAGVSHQKYPFYFYQSDKYISYDLKVILDDYKPCLQRLCKLKINGLIRNQEVEEGYLLNINELFGECISLEYYSKPTDLQTDWKCPILILKKIGKVYKLSGIAKDYWQP